MRLDLGDRRFQRCGRSGVRLAFRERRVGQVGTTQKPVGPECGQRDRDQDQDGGDAAPFEIVAARGARDLGRAGRDQPTRGFRARCRRLGLRQLAAIDVAVDLRELGLVETNLARRLGRPCAPERERPERDQNREAGHDGQSEPQHQCVSSASGLAARGRA